MTTDSKVRIVADSISPEGVRLTTVQGRFRRFVLSEANTHKVISKNSASSRAIPFEKQVAKIREDLAYPEIWATEQKGMQGGPPLDWDLEEAEARHLWEEAALTAIEYAEALRKIQVSEDDVVKVVHKSIVNRLLEPFMWHTVVFTATAWQNFFLQRCDEMAQPEIRVFAEAVRDAMEASTPRTLQSGEWHLPYVGDDPVACEWAASHTRDDDDLNEYHQVLCKISSARSAGVSYETQDGVRDPERDLKVVWPRLIDDRIAAGDVVHWSPLEHVATPWAANRQEGVLPFTPLMAPHAHGPSFARLDHLPKVGNLLGWRSLRTEVEALNEMVTYR